MPEVLNQVRDSGARICRCATFPMVGPWDPQVMTCSPWRSGALWWCPALPPLSQEIILVYKQWNGGVEVEYRCSTGVIQKLRSVKVEESSE